MRALVLSLWLAAGTASAQEPSSDQPPDVGEQVDGAIDRVADAPPAGEEVDSYPYLTIGVRAEIEYVNVEGEGGFSHLDPGMIAPRRRTAYVDIDKATVDFRLHLRDWLMARTELRADAEGARIDRLVLQAEVLDDWLDTFDLELEVARNRPMTRGPDRRVETYSPLGKTFWRGREWHAGFDGDVELGPLTLRLVGSLAAARPLGDEAMGEDSNLPTTAYSHADVGQDTQPEIGVLVGARAFGVRLEGFAHFGALLDDADNGYRRLSSTHGMAYVLAACGSPMPCAAFEDDTSRWYGARLAYDDHGFFFLAEYIQNRLGAIDRRGFEIGGSYTFAFDVSGERVEIEPFLRYGELTITNLPEVFNTTESWDRRQWVIALILRPIPVLSLSIEYLILDERADTSMDGMTEVDDDQLLIQLAFDAEIRP